MDDTKLQQSGALRMPRGPLFHAMLFSAVVNLLMLTGPLFMMQVYDRVLTSHSTATLVALLLIVTFLYAVLVGLDAIRARVLLGIGRVMRGNLDRRALAAGLDRGAKPGDAIRSLRELDALDRALAAPAAVAVMDLPWAPVFLAAIFALHPLLGWLAVCGGAALAALSALQARLCASDSRRSASDMAGADALARAFLAGQATITPLGMKGAAVARWSAAQAGALAGLHRLAARSAAFAALARGGRLYLQSILLAAGAWLCLRGELTGGGMVAASVIFGRFLAPVEGVIAGWQTLLRAWRARLWLADQLAALAPLARRLDLPPPTGALTLAGVAARRGSDGRAALSDISLTVRPGMILGLAGPSGAGKSTLLGVVAGLVSPDRGEVRFDGAALAQFDPDQLGRAIGYFPQEPAFFPATVAENIARLEAAPDADAVIAAARRAGAHEMILTLPQGYDTPIGPQGRDLSVGQARRIALARAFHGQPALLVLDEPDAGQDAEGLAALARTLVAHRAAGGAVLLASHRVRLLRLCDQVAVLEGGRLVRCGPPSNVLGAPPRDGVLTTFDRGAA